MTLVPDGRSGTCKTTGAGPRTFRTCQIGPHPAPQIPPPGAIRPPPTPPYGFFSNAGAPPEKPCLYVSSGPSDAHAAWCVCLLNQQAHQGALITGVRAGYRSRGTRRKEPTLVRAGSPGIGLEAAG